jgi:hypothetical protein
VVPVHACLVSSLSILVSLAPLLFYLRPSLFFCLYPCNCLFSSLCFGCPLSLLSSLCSRLSWCAVVLSGLVLSLVLLLFFLFYLSSFLYFSNPDFNPEPLPSILRACTFGRKQTRTLCQRAGIFFTWCAEVLLFFLFSRTCYCPLSLLSYLFSRLSWGAVVLPGVVFSLIFLFLVLFYLCFIPVPYAFP